MSATTPFGSEGFTDLGEQGGSTLYEGYTNQTSARTAAIDFQIQDWLRKNHRGLNLTAVPSSSAPLLRFAYDGHATATLLTTPSEPVVRWRDYVPPYGRGGKGGLGDVMFFAKYHYVWAGEDFIVYLINEGIRSILYILKEPNTAEGEDDFSHCAIVDKLILTACTYNLGNADNFIYVYDNGWSASRQLWDQIQDSNWEDVILDPAQKKQLQSVSNTFFDSKDIYKKYGVAWKRGLIFYGPPGNGKTISIKALMHELYKREKPIPTLYVKHAPRTYDIRSVFGLARLYSPCLLVMEDIETIVTSTTRSYFFNEVDGLENNDGILMVASTNYLERLDPGLANRPSRFDRKYLFPLPELEERTLYAQYWRRKLAKSAPKIDFPDSLCRPIAEIAQKFSFAYIQEAFVEALLDLARNDMEGELSGRFDMCEPVCEIDTLRGNKRFIGESQDRILVRWKGFPEAADTWEPQSVIARGPQGDELLWLYWEMSSDARPEYDDQSTALYDQIGDTNWCLNKDKHDGLKKNKLWVAIKKSVAVLKEDLGEGEDRISWKTPVQNSAAGTVTTINDEEHGEGSLPSRASMTLPFAHGLPGHHSISFLPDEASRPGFAGRSEMPEDRFRFLHGNYPVGTEVEDGPSASRIFPER